MSTGPTQARLLKCGDARRAFGAVEQGTAPDDVRNAVNNHVASCAACAFENRISRLERTVLDLAGAAQQITPDEAFFNGLRARIARGENGSQSRSRADQTWTMLMWVTARQVLPAMAILLLLIVGATLMWGTGNGQEQLTTYRPMDKIIVLPESDGYQPTADDVLESLVAVEENGNGR
ncbi:MAG TPA: hypothetical protein VFV34_04485 [Blastocatellia bacterium]|nr:hypothetical protein [Blastocatellia bacterium]